MASSRSLSLEESRSLLDHPLISERYFFPRLEPLPEPFWVACQGATLACSYRRVFQDGPTLVFFHGNGEIVADYRGAFEEAWNTLGLNVCLAEYRGYGSSSGKPLLATMLDDTDALLRALARPPSELVVMGRSLGSLYAIEMAARHPSIAGLILESGIADLAERLLFRLDPEEIGVSEDTFKDALFHLFDHETKLARFLGPLLVLHTQHDSLVSASHAERNYTWAASATKELRLFPQGDHNDILLRNWPEYWASIRRFLPRALPGLRPSPSLPSIPRF